MFICCIYSICIKITRETFSESYDSATVMVESGNGTYYANNLGTLTHY